jgi:hypothetical protein
MSTTSSSSISSTTLKLNMYAVEQFLLSMPVIANEIKILLDDHKEAPNGFRKATVLNSESKLVKKKGRRTKEVNIEESTIQMIMEKMFDATHAKCKAGIVDVLTSNMIIEIKHWKNWRNAIGQVLSYATCYPKHVPVICLYGRPRKYKLCMATMQMAGITVIQFESFFLANYK